MTDDEQEQERTPRRRALLLAVAVAAGAAVIVGVGVGVAALAGADRDGPADAADTEPSVSATPAASGSAPPTVAEAEPAAPADDAPDAGQGAAEAEQTQEDDAARAFPATAAATLDALDREIALVSSALRTGAGSIEDALRVQSGVEGLRALAPVPPSLAARWNQASERAAAAAAPLVDATAAGDLGGVERALTALSDALSAARGALLS